jgi:hypothetical protein
MQARLSILLSAVAAAALINVSAASAQALSGTVTSAQEGAMEGVLVTAKKDGSTISTTVVTNEKGQYAFPADRLDPGHYNIKIRAIGYFVGNRPATDVASGKTAVLGGLMLDSFEGQRDGLPVAGRIPIFGDLFSFRNDRAIRSELVVFVRPIVVRDPSVETDLAGYRRLLPDRGFFKESEMMAPALDDALKRMERAKADVTAVPVVPEPPPPGNRP